jgi:hypothetical protein
MIATGMLSFIATLLVRERAGLPLPAKAAPLTPSLLGEPV